MVKYAVWLEIDSGEWDYVRESKNNLYPCGHGHSWSHDSPIKLFNTKEAAKEESRRWNTGKVVEYGNSRSI